MKIQHLKNNLGFSLLQVLAATAILGIVSASLMGAIFEKAQFKAMSKTKTGIAAARSNLKNVMLHNVSWYYTIYDSVNETQNPEIACVRGTAEAFNVNCHAAEGKLRILDASQAVFYDSFSSSQGFNKEGLVCNVFDGASGNFDCPLRADVEWSANCSTDPCYKPTSININVKFTYKTSESDKKIAFNPSNYDFNFTSSTP